MARKKACACACARERGGRAETRAGRARARAREEEARHLRVDVRLVRVVSGQRVHLLGGAARVISARSLAAGEAERCRELRPPHAHQGPRRPAEVLDVWGALCRLGLRLRRWTVCKKRWSAAPAKPYLMAGDQNKHFLTLRAASLGWEGACRAASVSRAHTTCEHRHSLEHVLPGSACRLCAVRCALLRHRCRDVTFGRGLARARTVGSCLLNRTIAVLDASRRLRSSPNTRRELPE